MPDLLLGRSGPDLPWTLMYHAIASEADDPYRIQVTPELLRRHMDWLRRRGKRGVSLATLTRTPPDRRADLVGLTFDDGYADFAEQAVPVIEEFGFTASVYVVADRLGATNDWDGGPPRRLMTAAQVREVVARGMEVASHTSTHARLPDVDDDQLAHELRHSREILDEVLGSPGSVTGFAYPYGTCGERERRAVAAHGYEYAAAVDPGLRGGRWALPRTYVGQADTPWRLRAKRVRHAYRTRKASA